MHHVSSSFIGCFFFFRHGSSSIPVKSVRWSNGQKCLVVAFLPVKNVWWCLQKSAADPWSAADFPGCSFVGLRAVILALVLQVGRLQAG